MPRRRLALSLLGLALALGGCGEGSDSTTSTAGAGDRYFGEHPGQEETSLHIGTGDCGALAATVHRQTGASLRRASDPTPPNSHCQLQGAGVHVSISLDAAHAARTRYSNRIDEQVQFNAADPAKVPHAVPHVGDKGAYNQNAVWIPAYSTLWAVRGNRWLTVVYPAADRTRPQRLAAAASLARRAFKLTARQPGVARPSASPARR